MCSDVDTADFAPAAIVVIVKVNAPASTVLGASIVAREGAYADSTYADPATHSPIINFFWMAEGRPGTYTVTVRHPDHQTWTQSDVVVKQGTCGGETVSLTAQLQKLP